MRGEATRDRRTVDELWRTSSVPARYAVKLDDAPPRCHAWAAICRVLAPCHRADVPMLAEAVYGDASPANRVAMKSLLAQLCTGGGTVNHGHPYYRGGPYLKRVGRGWYAWPEDEGTPPSPARLLALLQDRPRTMLQLEGILGVCPDQVRRYMRSLRQAGYAISRDLVRAGARPGSPAVGVFWVEGEEAPWWSLRRRTKECPCRTDLGGAAAC